jgi:hypothetical protein
MKQVNIKKQKIVLTGYLFNILPGILITDDHKEQFEYHFEKKDILDIILDNISDYNSKKTVTLDKLTNQEINKAVYICQQIVQDVDYANNLFALSKKYRGLL